MGKCIIILVCISVCLINNIGCSLSSTDARKLNRTIQLVRSDLEYRLISALVVIDELRDNMGTCKCTDFNTTKIDLIAGRPDHSMSKEIEMKIANSLETSELRIMQGFQDEKVSRKIFEKKITKLVQDQTSSPDGLWSAWSSWGVCSASCLGGLSTRTRTCNSPSPLRFGHDCVGNSDSTKICNTHYCQDAQNGGWSGWSTWTDCSVEFGKLGLIGDQTRSRSCTNPAPSGFGRSCSGTDWQTRTCKGIRLVHGTSSHNGRVEVFLKGQWGTVCDDAFTDNAAKVVCRMLGLPTTTTTQYQNAHYGQGTGPIWLDNVQCTGTEHSMLDCKHEYTGSSITDCNHGEDVGVSCA